MTGTVNERPSDASDAAARYVRTCFELLGDRDPIEVQSQLVDSLERAIAGLSLAQLRQPERPGKWSVIEVIQHLADSEIVTGYRLRLILAGDVPAIPAYDQDAWAQRLRYLESSLPEALRQLRVLREGSLTLLRGLRPEEWERVGIHGERGRESVRQLTKLQAGHDLLHLRQIARIRAAIGAA
jgi:hypothetical protein